MEDDNYLATEACELPINTIYLSDNEIWYNIDFQIDSFNTTLTTLCIVTLLSYVD